MTVLVTGAAGFIGFHTAKYFLEHLRCRVIGVDNLNSYYSPSLKQARLQVLLANPQFTFSEMDFTDKAALAALFKRWSPEHVIHLGAQAGVGHSLVDPDAYTHSNISGFLSVLEACKSQKPAHLVFASSSSVYGSESRVPFSEEQAADKPLSYYAATKRANEMMAHCYANLYGLNITGVRIFTAYGPWGRPDMTPMLFADAIHRGAVVTLFNNGKNLRDFTYIDDVVKGIASIAIHFAAHPQPTLCRILNIGQNCPIEMRAFVSILARLIGKEAKLEYCPPQLGDMHQTCADLTRVREAVGYQPLVPLEEGLRRFVEWYTDYMQ